MFISGVFRWSCCGQGKQEGEIACQRKLLNHSISMRSFRQANVIVSPCEKVFFPSTHWLINWHLSLILSLSLSFYLQVSFSRRKSLRKSIKCKRHSHYLLRTHSGRGRLRKLLNGTEGSKGAYLRLWYLLRFIAVPIINMVSSLIYT